MSASPAPWFFSVPGQTAILGPIAGSSALVQVQGNYTGLTLSFGASTDGVNPVNVQGAAVPGTTASGSVQNVPDGSTTTYVVNLAPGMYLHVTCASVTSGVANLLLSSAAPVVQGSDQFGRPAPLALDVRGALKADLAGVDAVSLLQTLIDEVRALRRDYCAGTNQILSAPDAGQTTGVQ
jgi:hypothetical protein